MQIATSLPHLLQAPPMGSYRGAKPQCYADGSKKPKSSDVA
jgi:hypothetical protein